MNTDDSHAFKAGVHGFRVRPAGPGAITRAWAALEDALAPFATPGGVILRGAAWLVTAQRPGG